jgi:filamentous hemagglutinin
MSDCTSNLCVQQVATWSAYTKLQSSGSSEMTAQNLQGLQMLVRQSNAGVVTKDIVWPIGEAALNFLPLGSMVSKSGSGVATTAKVVTAEGTANAATYPLLKNQLATENLMNIAAQDSRLAKAVAGEAGIGSGTAAEADRLGRVWVGDGARLAKDQVNCPGCLWSADETRFYMAPTLKPNTPAEYSPTGVQANFEQWSNGKKISNGHLVVTP